MKIRMLGAARTVTGSCFIVETESCQFAVDCGMHQGGNSAEARNFDTSIYESDRWDFVLLTHAHIDHSGLLPRMARAGLHGPIYVTPPTKDLLEIMLLDSAHIQEMEAQWKTRKLLRQGGRREKVVPLYTSDDARDVFPLFRPIDYDRIFSPAPGVTVTYRDAGHILGAAFIEITIVESDGSIKIVFSGDIGRPAQLIVRDPTPLTEADVIFMESTYGNRDHKNEDVSLDELAEAVLYAYNNRGKVIIPSFAVERTQEIIYCLQLLLREGRIPRELAVFVDSPLAIQATDVFRRYSSYFDDEATELIRRGEDPLSMPQLKFTVSTEESMAINRYEGPAVVISASGMADAGRIKHHLKHNLWREGASIVFVGYQAQGTTGRKIVDGAKTVRIFGEEVAVKARVFTINGFSSHAGQTQLLDWLRTVRNTPRHIFLIHGEYEIQKVLASAIENRMQFPVSIPDYREEIELTAGALTIQVPPAEKILAAEDWKPRIAELERILGELKTGLPEGRPQELRERLQELKARVESLLAEL